MDALLKMLRFILTIFFRLLVGKRGEMQYALEGLKVWQLYFVAVRAQP